MIIGLLNLSKRMAEKAFVTARTLRTVAYIHTLFDTVCTSF
jgi:hypothetical protein